MKIEEVKEYARLIDNVSEVKELSKKEIMDKLMHVSYDFKKMCVRDIYYYDGSYKCNLFAGYSSMSLIRVSDENACDFELNSYICLDCGWHEQVNKKDYMSFERNHIIVNKPMLVCNEYSKLREEYYNLLLKHQSENAVKTFKKKV